MFIFFDVITNEQNEREIPYQVDQTSQSFFFRDDGYLLLSVNLYPTPRMEWKYTGFF